MQYLSTLPKLTSNLYIEFCSKYHLQAGISREKGQGNPRDIVRRERLKRFLLDTGGLKKIRFSRVLPAGWLTSGRHLNQDTIRSMPPSPPPPLFENSINIFHSLIHWPRVSACGAFHGALAELPVRDSASFQTNRAVTPIYIFEN